ncbi:MAG: LysR family transcriptional regulator [Candidatus Delongbacteria bacterium]|nr:LysR family transcriptional regulator [Candidatus Delongbacteria bacterium]MBN2834938.1 LysR family transcriptional regulator [Candidatus Delongbacteria bacterium]
MDYRDKVFLQVAENKSFSKAAEILSISQPAVSKHIKEIEFRYNTVLFERKGNKVHLTESGKIAYKLIKDISLKYRELEYLIGINGDRCEGELIIGASSTISQYIVPEVIASFYKKHPNLKVSLINGNSREIEIMLGENEIDLALVENESSKSDLRYIKFLDDELNVITAKNSSFSQYTAVKVEDLIEMPIVLRESGSGTLEVLRKAFKRKEVSIDDLKKVIYLGSSESIKNFLNSFDGVTIISRRAVLSELESGRFVSLKTEDISFRRKLRIVLRRGLDSQIVELFVDFLLHYNFKL